MEGHSLVHRHESVPNTHKPRISISEIKQCFCCRIQGRSKHRPLEQATAGLEIGGFVKQGKEEWLQEEVGTDSKR